MNDAPWRDIRPLTTTPAPVSVAVPGSKSCTHRTLIAAALSNGPCQVFNPLDSDDTRLTRQALEQMNRRALTKAMDDYAAKFGQNVLQLRLQRPFCVAEFLLYVIFRAFPDLRVFQHQDVCLDHFNRRCSHRRVYPSGQFPQLFTRGFQGVVVAANLVPDIALADAVFTYFQLV